MHAYAEADLPKLTRIEPEVLRCGFETMTQASLQSIDACSGRLFQTTLASLHDLRSRVLGLDVATATLQ